MNKSSVLALVLIGIVSITITGFLFDKSIKIRYTVEENTMLRERFIQRNQVQFSKLDEKNQEKFKKMLSGKSSNTPIIRNGKPVSVIYNQKTYNTQLKYLVYNYKIFLFGITTATLSISSFVFSIFSYQLVSIRRKKDNLTTVK